MLGSDNKGMEEKKVSSLKPKPDTARPKSSSDSAVHGDLGITGIMKRPHAELDVGAREEVIPFSGVSYGTLSEKDRRESRFSLICFPSVKTPPSLKEGEDNRTKSWMLFKTRLGWYTWLRPSVPNFIAEFHTRHGHSGHTVTHFDDILLRGVHLPASRSPRNAWHEHRFLPTASPTPCPTDNTRL